MIKTDLIGQAQTFLLLTACGGLLGCVFDLYRALRGIRRPRGLMTMATDLFYWILATFIIGGTLLYSNWGELRLYVFVALILGAVGYFRFCSQSILRLIMICMLWLTGLMKWIKIFVYHVIINPVSYSVRLLACPFAAAGRKIEKWREKLGKGRENPPF